MNKSIFFLHLTNLCLLLATAKTAGVTIITQQSDHTPITYFLALKASYEQMTGNYSHATSSYAHLKKNLPHDPALTRAELKLLFEQKRYQEVLAHHQSCNDLSDRLNKEPLFLIAQSYLFTGKEQEAIALFSKLITAYPLDDWLYYFKAMAQTKSGDTAGAQKTIATALAQPAFASKHYLFHFLKAKAAVARNTIEEAEKELITCVHQNPSFAQGFFLLATLAESTGNPALAMAHYERSLALNPYDKSIVPHLIKLAIKTNAYSRAQELLTRYPATTTAYFYDKTLLHLAQQEYEAAQHTTQQGFCHDPTDKRLQELAITALMAQGKTAQLITTAAQWLSATPNNTELVASIIEMRNKKIPIKTIIKIFKKAAQKTESWLLRCTLGDIYHEQSNYIKARRWYDAALRDKSLPTEDGTIAQIHKQIALTHQSAKV